MDAVVASMEGQVSSPILILGRIVTMMSLQLATRLKVREKAGLLQTPKFSKKYFDEERCYASSKRDSKIKNKHPRDLCRTVRLIRTTPLSSQSHEREPTVEIPNVQPAPNV